MSEDDTDTNPVATVPLTIPPRPPLPQQAEVTSSSEAAPYDASIDGLSAEELRLIDIHAAGVALGVKQSGLPAMVEMLMHTLPQVIESRVAAAVEQALAQRDAVKEVERPDDYKRRRKVIWLAGKLAIPVLIAIGCVYPLTFCAPNGQINWAAVGIITLLFLGPSVFWAWLVYFLWSITFIVCNLDSTGIQRRDIRWLPIAELTPELETARIIIRKKRKNQFLKLFGIDYWTVWLDTAADGESPDVKKLRGVARGDLFLKTLISSQRYIKAGG